MLPKEIRHKMYPYVRNESEADEFNAIFDIAGKLFSRRISDREKAAKKLDSMGRKAVRPLVYTLECGIQGDMHDDDFDALSEEVEDILIKIGKDTLPDLEDFVTNGSCNMYVNEFAQEAIFKVMGLEGKDKGKVCKHIMMVLHEEGKKRVWQCVFCDAEFEYKKDKSK